MADIEVGSIIFYYHSSIYPPKNKYAVVISAVKKWCFLINSEDREHYHCLPIQKGNHAFLKHDSFISCSNFFEYDPSKVSKIVGALSKAEKSNLCNHLSKSRTINKVNKEIILSELGLEI